jgi:hypothetical protein
MKKLVVSVVLASVATLTLAAPQPQYQPAGGPQTLASNHGWVSLGANPNPNPGPNPALPNHSKA